MDETSILYSVATTLLFHCLITPCLSTPSITTDQSALLSLKSSISYDPENVISRNWSSSTPVCSWTGIVCSSRHERVTALDISDMNLEGSISPELGNLSFLLSLKMSNNSFGGSLPQELANLRRLRSIDLRRNNLSGLVPSFFSSLPNLQFLYLSRNKFSGPIPTSIANISKLEELALNLNFLEGTIPKEIGNLRYLTFLNLEGNRLTGSIPLPIFNLSALQAIGLSGNRLTGRLPASICDSLPVLEGLYLSSNWLDGTIPSSLQKCDQLKVLSLSGNEFIGSIPREIGNLTRLTLLHLGANNLEGQIPKEIGNLQKLEVFGLNRNQFSGSLPASIFNISALQIFTSVGTNLSGELPPNFGQGTPNLEDLYLGMNNLSGFIPDSISNASKLTILDLSNNSFTGPIPDSLGNLNGLELLNLGDNKFINPSSSELTFLTSLTMCRGLRELVIGENPLSGKLPASIGNFSTSLTIFAAYRCIIQGRVPEEIGNLSSLAMLSLFDNELTGNIPTTVIGLQKLQQIYLHNNKITGFIPNEFCSLENLGALDLSQNQILGALPASGIWSLNHILNFNASANKLNGHLPPEIGNLKALTLIDLSMNNFSGNIPITIGGLESLIDFSLAHNGLEGPIPDSLSRALSLESSDFSHNYLTGEIPMSLEALLYLRYLNVSFNKLSGEIPNGGPFVNFTHQSFMSNEALCGASRFQVPRCRFNSPNKPRKKRVLSIALYTILGFASITIALVGLVLLRCRKERKDADQTHILPEVSHERITYDELQEATNGFSKSNMLGMGGFSSVYKGTLKDGSLVAVKVFNMKLEGAFKSFDTECEVLRSLRHRNLTKVISSCTNADFRALVLEYMPSGSLENWLYSHNSFLDILQRLNIMIDVACALDYLHNDYIMPVVHCDLKPSNVLLDKELVGHVSDFGISKILGAGENTAQTSTLATIGYVAPEYGVEGLVSTRSDMYSYGILLMETFTRMKPSDDLFAGELSLKHWVKDSLPGDITVVIDSNLLTQEEENFDAKVQCLLSVMELALKCTEELPHLRISIKDAVMMLNKIKLQFLTNCGRR
ncbi:hypothetical protein Pfo_012487 [Paulownia fortunei]|nr:hypothetical protein Pfo_012487 [Paulownia fortunei]